MTSSNFSYFVSFAFVMSSEVELPETGVELSGPTPSKNPISSNSGTESGTVDDDRGQNDPDLAYLIKVWPSLQDTVKQDILNLIRQHGGDDHE